MEDKPKNSDTATPAPRRRRPTRRPRGGGSGADKSALKPNGGQANSGRRGRGGPRPGGGGFGRVPEIKPGADNQLKKVFAEIGVPERAPFSPDPFQLEAVAAISQGDCLVTAPTGSGKTWIAEQAIKKTLESGGHSWYASPLKALSNAKYLDFCGLFGEQNVGILTGDRKENAEASVIVGTTEILRNQLYDAMHHGQDLGADLVILDEAHFLGDADRGVVWEEIMIYLPNRIPLLLLSATIGNAPQIAAWLSASRGRPCIVVEETERPVPLYPLFFHPTGTLYPLFAGGEARRGRLQKNVREYVNLKNPPVLAPPRRLPPMGEVLEVLDNYNLLPAIIFLKSRADCDNSLDLCIDRTIASPERAERLRARIAEFLEQSPHFSDHRQLWHLQHLGVGAHHSGQLPAWKLFVEKLMTEGLLDTVFATSTVAAGVNFPARTVAFLNSDRFNGVEFLPLNPTELHQMTGRAGRRGMDNIGFAAAIPGKFMDMELIGRLFNSPPANVFSQIKINFSMTLNLLLSHGPEQIKNLLDRSFATHLLVEGGAGKKGKKKKAKDPEHLWRDFVRHLDFLKETVYVRPDGSLNEDGVWASQLRVDEPVLIAEGLRKGLFPVEEPALLAGVIAAFVNEREVDDRIERRLVVKKLSKALETVREGLGDFSKLMIERGFGPKPLYLRPALSLYLWASETLSWPDLLNVADLAEGDMAMLVLRTADNLRHIRSLSDVFPQAADSADRAIEAILRDPVVTHFEA